MLAGGDATLAVIVGAVFGLAIIAPVGANFEWVAIASVRAAVALVAIAPVGAAFGDMMNRILPGAITTCMLGTAGGASGTGGAGAELRNSSRLRFV